LQSLNAWRSLGSKEESMSVVSLPVIGKIRNDEGVGGPASAMPSAKIAAAAIDRVAVDEGDFSACIRACVNLLELASKQFEHGSTLRVASLGFELGVSLTGKVGFLGTGTEGELAATFQITLNRGTE
jgi:hypothetical protein